MSDYPLLELTGSPAELEIATALLHEHECLGTEEKDGRLRAYSMVATHEGASSVRAIDVDPAAVECARANIERNGLSDRIRVERASWQDVAPIRAGVVVANINTTILTRAVHSMFGTLLLSGILVEEADELTLPEDSEVAERRSAGEWAALVIQHG